MELSQLEGVKLALEWIGEYMEVHQFLNVSFWRLQEKCMLQILPPPPPGLYSLDSCESVDLPTEDEIYMHLQLVDLFANWEKESHCWKRGGDGGWSREHAVGGQIWTPHPGITCLRILVLGNYTDSSRHTVIDRIPMTGIRLYAYQNCCNFSSLVHIFNYFKLPSPLISWTEK